MSHFLFLVYMETPLCDLYPAVAEGEGMRLFIVSSGLAVGSRPVSSLFFTQHQQWQP